jgi:hypothetical protein
MQAEETTLQKLIEGDKRFQVPLYQRTFTWQEKELGTLWTDVLDQANALRDGPGSAGHPWYPRATQ